MTHMDESERNVDDHPRSAPQRGHEFGSCSRPAHMPPSRCPGEHPAPSSQPSSLLNRWWMRALDGERGWGSIDISLNSHGFRSYRLVVFPPGISQAERRSVRMWRAWPTWGALVWLILMICAVSVLPPWGALACSATVYLAAGAITFVLAGDTRSQVRTLSVVRIDGHVDARQAAKYDQLETLARVLTQADVMRGQGRLSVVDHEVAWWHVYDCLSPDPTLLA
jgi:hypothetical protein